MGVSTDAIIVYGLDIGEDLHGMPFYSEEKDEEGWAYDEQFEEWVKKEFGDECPFEILIHCSYDYPMYIFALKETYLSASRGYSQEFDPQQLQEKLTEEKKKHFTDVIEKYNIKGENGETEPSWLLFSLWG
jgi:hypothetical protein